jgi:trk system potassium uptake protein TrkH
MLPPVVVALIFDDGTWMVFVQSSLIIAGAGLLLWWPVRKVRNDMRLRDGFLVVALFWIVLGSFGATPYLISAAPQMSFTDAIFESMSGLTTTGATVLTQVDGLPPAILYYRQQLSWFGGLGIIVLAVAVLPMLGVGGMQLYRAEMPGPVKDAKLTPRIAQTAKALWYIYLGTTIACVFAYWLAGMSPFDAICHGLSTVATSGLSTHDASLGHFESTAIEMVAVLFMIIAAANFSLHFLAWRERGVKHYFTDPEFRAYLGILAALSSIVIAALFWQQTYERPEETLTTGLFQAVSMATTTGFIADDFSRWPVGLPVLLIFATFIGGCANSTAGGMKVMRWMLMYKQGTREFQRLIHPNAEIPVKLGRKAIPARVVDAVWGFFAVYVVVFAVLLLIMLTTGMEQTTAFSAVAAMLNNVGQGLNDVADGFADVPAIAKWCAIWAMLLGRLEIFTLLVLVTPAFWRG